MSQTKQNWIRYTGLLKEKLPSFYDALLPGVSEEKIAATEERLLKKGIVIPQELKDLYSINGGENRATVEGCIGFSLHRFLSYGPLEDMEDNGGITSIPEGHVKILYNSKNWIPFADDNIGGSLCIDLDPDENGTVGQVISFDSDCDDRIVFAKSLPDFLQYLINKLEADDYMVDAQERKPRILFTEVEYDEDGWYEPKWESLPMSVYGKVDEENDLLGKRKA